MSLRGAGTAHTFNVLDAGSLAFTRSPGGDGGTTNTLLIDKDGNVGIGTTSVFSNFDVMPYNSGAGTSLVANYTTQMALGGNYNTGANCNGGGTTCVKLWIGAYDNDGATIYPIYVEDENNYVDFYVKNSATQGGISSAYFRGNVGIGTTNPSTFALEVAGDIGPEATGTRNLGSASRYWSNL